MRHSFFIALAFVAGCDRCPLEPPVPIPDAIENVDTFTQRGAARVDILWMVDNSGSMASEQNKVAARFHEFFAQLVASGVDYHIGVVTSDPNEGGALRAYDGPDVTGCNACRFLTKDVPCSDTAVDVDGLDEAEAQAALVDACPAQLVFRDLIRVGIDGSAFEEGFTQVASALGADVVDPETGLPLGDVPPENEGFLRDDAALYVVFVSDEDEGDGADDTDVRYYQRLFEGLKGTGNENNVALAAITGYPIDAALPPAREVCDVLSTTFDVDLTNDDPRAAGLLEALRDDSEGCRDLEAPLDDPNAGADTGGRYIELACRTGGVVANMCEADYSDALDALGANAAGLARKFVLTHGIEEIEWGNDCQPLTLDDVALDCDDDRAFGGAFDGPLCVTATDVDEDEPRLVPHSEVDGWTLEPSGAVRFGGGFLPKAGTDITVRYAVRTRPCI
jgi:hypothetical protein